MVNLMVELLIKLFSQFRLLFLLLFHHLKEVNRLLYKISEFYHWSVSCTTRFNLYMSHNRKSILLHNLYTVWNKRCACVLNVLTFLHLTQFGINGTDKMDACFSSMINSTIRITMDSSSYKTNTTIFWTLQTKIAHNAKLHHS